jgi:hypothetical protein
MIVTPFSNGAASVVFGGIRFRALSTCPQNCLDVGAFSRMSLDEV